MEATQIIFKQQNIQMPHISKYWIWKQQNIRQHGTFMAITMHMPNKTMQMQCQS
jgi:hypothetical protein